MTGALLVASRHEVTMRWFLGNTMLLGASGLVLSFAPNIWVAYATAIPVGIGGAAFLSSANAILQQNAPPDMRGRLLALSAVAFLGSTPLGGPITGWIGDRFGAPWSLAYGSAAAILVVMYVTAVSGRAQAVAPVPSDAHS